MATLRQTHYDVCVVGSGLIGSAAARHLVESNPSLKIALIGPDEPQDQHEADVFGSWYDQSRFTHMLDLDLTWGVLSQRAINRYQELEKKSGIEFYWPVGILHLGVTGSPLIAQIQENTGQLNQETELIPSHALKDHFPYLQTQPYNTGLYCRKNAGIISPRKMVYAQQQVCRQQGCDVIQEVVGHIDPHKPQGWILNLTNGQHITANKVLVAVGAFSGFHSLLPGNIQPDMVHYGIIFLLVQIDADELPRFKGMPGIRAEELVDGAVNTDYRSFLFPPIKYPDGKFYIKIDAGRSHRVKLETPGQIREWFIRGSDLSHEQWLLDRASHYLPELRRSRFMFCRCVVPSTQTVLPYVDMIAPGFGVALGGCDFGAKSSDEIGCIAARMIAKSGWDYDLPAEQFKFKSRPASSRL